MRPVTSELFIPYPKRTLVETPYRGDQQKNELYCRLACRHSISEMEAPYASHIFYTQMLDDGRATERDYGIKCGLYWGTQAEQTVVYTDLGTSQGMQLGISAAEHVGRPVIRRTLPGWQNIEKAFDRRRSSRNALILAALVNAMISALATAAGSALVWVCFYATAAFAVNHLIWCWHYKRAVRWIEDEDVPVFVGNLGISS